MLHTTRITAFKLIYLIHKKIDAGKHDSVIGSGWEPIREVVVWELIEVWLMETCQAVHLIHNNNKKFWEEIPIVFNQPFMIEAILLLLLLMKFKYS